MNWDDAGKSEGIQIWRVENVRDDDGNPKFGINPWPTERYGEFYNGDSYIVLQTTKDEDSSSFVYDIFFWIGSKSSQDEYGVAAYKANELDDLLDDAPVQHREVQNHETEMFMKCFKDGVRVLDGGIESGFRHVDDTSDEISLPKRMFRIRKTKPTRSSIQSIEVAPTCDSLNQGDAFIFHSGKIVYYWFGETCSPHEKYKAREIAQRMAAASNGKVGEKMVEDDDEEFWNLIGGKGEIKEADEEGFSEVKKFNESKMYVVSDVDSILKVEQREATKSNLVSDDVCLIDIGDTVFVWIGSGSSKREQTQAMVLVQKHLSCMGRSQTTNVVRVKEGQESRISGFASSLP